MDTRYLTTAESPAGPLHVVVTESGVVTGIWFGVITSLAQVEQTVHGYGFAVAHDPEPANRVLEQLAEYSSHRRKEFDLPLAPTGSEWEIRVWTALSDIPYGETRSYGQIASVLGDPTKARAVGWANAANPIPVVIPCHRVIGAQGNLTGFGGGIDAKIQLLSHEGAMLPGFA